ncbi:hypothetical protein Pcinc_034948 [Petrolisthes cinctipes]|uniref:Uncharacterized protein n=1 Tax=Petrolisthes cinctipes TaxID=88211 RepID=A0AAE1BXR7_PETCI|nr:hypothetical protein Pcinc_034948 [Petrolisthes cinctipes]
MGQQEYTPHLQQPSIIPLVQTLMKVPGVDQDIGKGYEMSRYSLLTNVIRPCRDNHGEPKQQGTQQKEKGDETKKQKESLKKEQQETKVEMKEKGDETKKQKESLKKEQQETKEETKEDQPPPLVCKKQKETLKKEEEISR